MKRCILSAAAAIGSFAAFGAYYTNETVRIEDKNEFVYMNGGTVEYARTANGSHCASMIQMIGTADTTFTAIPEMKRPIHFCRDVFSPGGGQLVMSESAEFGAWNTGCGHNATPSCGYYDIKKTDALKPGYTGYPFLGADAFTFSNPDDCLTISGRVSLASWPTFPYKVAKGDIVMELAGANMIGADSPFVKDGVFDLDGYYGIRWASPLAIDKNVKIRVPKDSYVYLHRVNVDVETGKRTYPTGSNQFTNDLIMAGGTLQVRAQYNTYHYGDISGTGIIIVEQNGLCTAAKTYYRRFNGSLRGFTGILKLYSGDGVSYMDNKVSRTYLAQDEPGCDITIFAATNALTYCSFYPNENQAGNWRVPGLVDARGVYENPVFGTQGAAWFFLSDQHVTYDDFKGGMLLVNGSSKKTNTVSAIFNKVASGSELVVSNGLDIVINGGSGAAVRYDGKQKFANTVTLATGVTLESLDVPQGDEVTVSGGEILNVTGTGTLVVNGNVRLGRVAPTVQVRVEGGEAAFGSGVDVSTVLGARPAVWFDASDTRHMVGAYNAKWATSTAYGGGKSVLAKHPAVMLNGALAATYTNGYPLIEKWFDKRDEQDVNFLWQYRSAGYNNTLYTLVLPYLVLNGLNGKPYMSFGEHGTTDLDVEEFGFGREKGTTDSLKERRRMILMRGEKTGGAIQSRATIMVFGSQNGGGRALVGGYGTSLASGENPNDRSNWPIDANTNPSCGANYTRGGDSSSYVAANAIFKAATRKTWVNGSSVDPTETGLSGGWDIISFTNAASYFRSLGQSSNWKYSGGQNYAELITFTNAITAAERQAVEEYLACKWGLPTATKREGAVTVAAGAKVSGALASVTGSGLWETPRDAMFTVPAGFTGTISGAANLTASDVVGLDEDFTGSVKVTGDDLHFTYENGAFANAMVATDASLAFPTAVTINLSFGDAVPGPGEYDLVSAGTLTGLDEITAVTSDCSKRLYEVRKDGNRLVLTVSAKGMTLLVK